MNYRMSTQKIAVVLTTISMLNAARADVKYTTVSSFALKGVMTPQTTVITWMKEGLKRNDTFQKIGPVVSENSVVMNAPKRQIIYYCKATKMYNVAVLGPDGSPLGSDSSKSSARKKPAKSAGKPKTGAIVVTTNIQSLGLEKLLAHSARHYILNTTTELSGCAGNSKTKNKSEVWMADIVLPLFNIPGAKDNPKDIEDAYIDDEDDCRPTFRHICDTAAYNKSTSGLVIKSIAYDESGKAIGQTEITTLSFAKLPDSVFALPAGYKKVTRLEYDKAISALMMKDYISKYSDVDASADADDTSANTSMEKLMTPIEDTPEKTKETSEVAPIAAPTSSTRYAPVALKNDAKLDKSLLDDAKEMKTEDAIALLQNGANPNYADKSGKTPLMFAAQNGKTELVSALLDMGANSNVVNKKGQSALHFATMIGQPKPKKKKFGGLGGMLGGAVLGNVMGSGSLGDLGNFGSLLGAGGLDNFLGNNLTGLLNGGVFNLSGKSGWMAIIGTAMQGDIKSNGAFGLQSLLGGNQNLDASGWINLIGAVKGSNSDVLRAMSNVGGSDAKWSQFMNVASSGDLKNVTNLMKDAKLKPLLDQAMQGFSAATGELPSNAAKNIVASLLQKGATANLADGDGKTAAQLFAAREWNDVAALLQQ